MQSQIPASGTAKRLPRACPECARRKTRCDRRRPCRPCLQRNQARQCIESSLETPGLDIAAVNIEATGLSLSLMKERVAELEAQLSGTGELLDGQDEGDDNEVSGPANPREDHARHESDSLDAVIEQLNLGAHLLTRNSRRSFLLPRSPVFQQGRHLPSRLTSLKIVTFTLNELGWIHCALRASVFFQEHERFWAALQGSDYSVLSNHAWLAILNAVLAVGIYYMEPAHPCFMDFAFLDPETPQRPPRSQQECANLSKIWYYDALYELEHSDFLGTSQLSSVQTIAILPLLNASLGESEREWLMLGAAINVARSLQMHRLGSEVVPSESGSLPEWSTMESRALGRRLWWTVCICDWLGNMTRPTSIAPGSSNTEMMRGIDDQDIILERPHIKGCKSSDMSLLDYHQAMARLAATIQAHVKDGRSASIKNLAAAMQAVEEIYESCPAHLRDGRSSTRLLTNTIDCHHHRWADFQGYLFTHTLHFLRLTIARSLLNHWISRRTDRHDFHKKAIDAAEAIVRQKTIGAPQMFQKSWIVCASTVAAGVILALDLLCFCTGVDESVLSQRRESINTCIASLDALQIDNAISKGGPDVLRRLLFLDSTWDHSTPKDKHALRSILDYVTHRNVAAEQAHTPEPIPSSASPCADSPAETSVQMEWTTTSPDTFDVIFATACNEIDLFENPFEFNDSYYYSPRQGL